MPPTQASPEAPLGMHKKKAACTALVINVAVLKDMGTRMRGQANKGRSGQQFDSQQAQCRMGKVVLYTDLSTFQRSQCVTFQIAQLRMARCRIRWETEFV